MKWQRPTTFIPPVVALKTEIAGNIHFDVSRETMLHLLVCIIWASMLLAFMRGIINRLPVLGDHTDEVIPLFIIIPTILALPSLLNKLCLADYLFFFLLVFHYLSSYVFFPENEAYLTENIFLCVCCAYPYYFIGRVTDIDKLYGIFVALSAFCIYMNLYYYLVYTPKNRVVDPITAADNMYTAYRALPHVLMLMWSTLQRFRIWKAATTLFGILFLLSCGTRGPLACLGFFTTVYFFCYMNFKGAIYLKTAIVGSLLLAMTFINQIAVYLFRIFLDFNLSTRIIEKFVYGELGNDSQRGDLRDILYNVLDNGEHFWGLGLFGCQNYGVIYAHFLPLDFFSTYGYFAGSVLLTLLAVLTGMALWVTRGKKAQEFIVLLLSLGIVKLMLTGTFVNEPYFYFLIGFCAKELLSALHGENGSLAAKAQTPEPA